MQAAFPQAPIHRRGRLLFGTLRSAQKRGKSLASRGPTSRQRPSSQSRDQESRGFRFGLTTMASTNVALVPHHVEIPLVPGRVQGFSQALIGAPRAGLQVGGDVLASEPVEGVERRGIRAPSCRWLAQGQEVLHRVPMLGTVRVSWHMAAPWTGEVVSMVDAPAGWTGIARRNLGQPSFSTHLPNQGPIPPQIQPVRPLSLEGNQLLTREVRAYRTKGQATLRGAGPEIASPTVGGNVSAPASLTACFLGSLPHALGPSFESGPPLLACLVQEASTTPETTDCGHRKAIGLDHRILRIEHSKLTIAVFHPFRHLLSPAPFLQRRAGN